jgi:hypothetical protein
MRPSISAVFGRRLDHSSERSETVVRWRLVISRDFGSTTRPVEMMLCIALRLHAATVAMGVAVATEPIGTERTSAGNGHRENVLNFREKLPWRA